MGIKSRAECRPYSRIGVLVKNPGVSEDQKRDYDLSIWSWLLRGFDVIVLTGIEWPAVRRKEERLDFEAKKKEETPDRKLFKRSEFIRMNNFISDKELPWWL